MKISTLLAALFLISSSSFAEPTCPSFERIVVGWYSAGWTAKGTAKNRQETIDSLKKNCESWSGAVRENSILDLSKTSKHFQVGLICQLPSAE